MRQCGTSGNIRSLVKRELRDSLFRKSQKEGTLFPEQFFRTLPKVLSLKRFEKLAFQGLKPIEFFRWIVFKDDTSRVRLGANRLLNPEEPQSF